ncbi:MAG: hypothetical protein HRU20_14260 [Pseudomonadales bacterium]|nr:hypothetical protein [Pseudomonadales bacterium]
MQRTTITFRSSYLPPLMVYMAAGISGLTAIVSTFFVKESLGLSAEFLAAIAFWSSLIWAAKMPIGHLVDLLWRYKAVIVFVGAGLIACSLGIMLGLISQNKVLLQLLAPEHWFIIATLVAPLGYALQDVVADAMTVEAVPTQDPQGKPYNEKELKAMHTTMQALGRFAIIGGSVLVAGLNIWQFNGIETMGAEDKNQAYINIYLCALMIPLISVAGVILHTLIKPEPCTTNTDSHATQINYWILIGSIIFVLFSLFMGLSDFALAQESVFIGSFCIISFLLFKLSQNLDQKTRTLLFSTAIVIFAFRAVPGPGAGASWFQIDQLGFDQQFFSILSFIASLLTLLGIAVYRRYFSELSIAYVIVALSIMQTVMTLPNLALYYGIQEWTAAITGGVVDARFIAIMDTALESPLGQIAMIPMLAWIAQSAPAHLKATFFAVMASFMNLALSASQLLTQYLNKVFIITREVVDPATSQLVTTANYENLGFLLITIMTIGLLLPLTTVWLLHKRM